MTSREEYSREVLQITIPFSQDICLSLLICALRKNYHRGHSASDPPGDNSKGGSFLLAEPLTCVLWQVSYPLNWARRPGPTSGALKHTLNPWKVLFCALPAPSLVIY